MPKKLLKEISNKNTILSKDIYSSQNSIKEKPKEEKNISQKLINTKTNKNNQKFHKKWRSRSPSEYKYNRNTKLGLIRGPWSVQENELLTEWVEKNGPKLWTLCSEFIKGRTGKQCREHWNNCLNPKLIKGEWTPEEDFLIMYFYLKCNGSWKTIINLFEGRTENSVKNRFFSQLRKIAKSYLSSSEKRFSSKIKLDELLKYLNIGIFNSKKKYMKEKNYNEEDLNEFLNKMEKKLNIKKKKEKDSIQGEENEINDTYISSNLSNLENSQTLSKKETKGKSLFNKKRKREEYDDMSISNSMEKDEFKNIQNDKVNNQENNFNNYSNISQNNNINNNDKETKINNNNIINETKESSDNNKSNQIEIKKDELEDKYEDLNMKNQQLIKNEIITNENNNINKSLQKKDSVNSINNTNFNLNNSFFDPFQNQYLSFDNYTYNTHNDMYPYENENPLLKCSDSLSDLQNIIGSNFTTKQSSDFLNENKIIENNIENLFTFNKDNEYNPHYFF